MKYELLEATDAGIIVDPTPILRDIKDTFAVSFILPDSAAYIALFRDERGQEYKTPIRNGEAQIPAELITKEQHVGLTVCRVEDGAITRAWECRSLYVGAFLYMRQSQWQITAGTDDTELYARLATIEREHAQAVAGYKALQDDYKQFAEDTAQLVAEIKRGLCEATKALASLKTASETIAAGHNNAIAVLNDLSGRVSDLEKNYDPTIIGG